MSNTNTSIKKNLFAAAAVVQLGTPCGGYTLTTAATPPDGGSVTPLTGPAAPDGARYSALAKVTLSAIPAPGYKFSGWAGALTEGNDVATYTMRNSGNMPLVTTETMPSTSLCVASRISSINSCRGVPSNAPALITDSFSDAVRQVIRHPQFGIPVGATFPRRSARLHRPVVGGGLKNLFLFDLRQFLYYFDKQPDDPGRRQCR